MKQVTGIIGPVGLVLVIIGAVTYGILHGGGPLAVLPLLAGILLVVISLFLGDRSVESRRRRRLELNTGLSIVLFAALLVLLQTIAIRNDRRFDTTANRRFSLSPQTRAVLDGLEADVAVTLFIKDTAPGRRKTEDLLREYSAVSPRLRWRFVDPDRDPLVAREFGIENPGTIVVESGERRVDIDGGGEQQLTNALLRVLRSGGKTVCFTTGHGEKSIHDAASGGYAQLADALLDVGYEARDTLLATLPGIPDDCEVIVVAGPTADLFPREATMLDEYLDEGGKVLLLLEPLTGIPRLRALARRHGIEVHDDMVIDRFGQLVAGNSLAPVVNTYADHPVTRGLRELSFFPQARSVEAVDPAPDGVETVLLGKTAAGAFSETNLDSLIAGKSRFDPGEDVAGPVAIAAVASRDLDPAERPGAPIRRRMRLVVFGDADFAMNANIGVSGHHDLILNAIGWLAEEEDLLAIRPRDPLMQPVVLTDRQGRIVFWLPVVALPLLVAGGAVLVTIRRRRSA